MIAYGCSLNLLWQSFHNIYMSNHYVVHLKSTVSYVNYISIKLEVNSKGNQSWTFIGGTDVEAETPILWPFDAKSQLTGKDPGAGKDCRQEEMGMTENKIVGWHHWLNVREWVWASSGRWWMTGMLQSTGSERVRHDWVSEWIKNPPAMLEIQEMLGRSPGGGHGNPLQYSCLENPMDRGAQWATVSPWGCKELDTTEVTEHSTKQHSFVY